MFNGSRLQLARHRLGLSLTKLAEASGVSARSLTTYENDPDAEPSEDNLRKLAEALNVSVTFFAREGADPIEVEAASFRKLSKTTATTRNAVLASATLAVEFFGLVEEKFTLPNVTIPTLDKLSPARAAELLRRQWDLGDRPISNMVHLLESKGVRVVALSHDFRDVDAFCFLRDSIPYVFLNTSKSAERQRFDAAHELGHLVLHSDLEMRTSDSKEREAEANQFASNFLMPTEGVLAQNMGAASLDRILLARSFWKVSAMAMTHRLHALDLLNDWQYRTMCVTLSDLGYRSREPGGIVPETSKLLKKVLFGKTVKVSLRDAATELSLNQSDLRTFLQGLVPVAA
ncbi:XRE family transcriptional regulator [Lacisediminihabitans changchengi]|uniref:XRE family transcriptional regulator n=1 Tax=Lacisediminihabitans changchengi TaxID=2787634 RepID=A0A934SJ73_9MICO|nr:XRE family transcriptional regulator [Lacisediminihabitans changchengi]MBK4347677.1 XRE family transcriptional regulator [Lacisediminihabitans changchengi]